MLRTMPSLVKFGPWLEDETHEATGVHNASCRCGDLAGRGACTAARPHAANRSADGLFRGRSGRAVIRRGVPGRARKEGVDGRWQSLRIELRWAAGDEDRIRTFAKELVGLQPDAIVGVTTGAVSALAHERSAIPIVFANVIDPIGNGFAASLARPGGNITGFMILDAAIGSNLFHVRVGKPVEEILAEAKAEDVDLMILPVCGGSLGSANRLSWRNFSRRSARRRREVGRVSRCPLLIVHARLVSTARNAGAAR